MSQFGKRSDPPRSGNGPGMAPPLPHNLDAERAVLGALILNTQAGMAAFPIVKPDEFFLEQHRVVYRAVQNLVAEGSPVDLVLLTDELMRTKRLESAGGVGYVAQLIDGVPKVSNVEYYARTVHEKAQRRQLIHLCEKMEQDVFADEADPSKLLEKMIERLLDIAADSRGVPAVRSWYDVAQEAMQHLREAHSNPGSVATLKFGLSELDELTSGLRKKELVVIVGPSSHGKTLLASQLAITAEQDGYRGLIFSAEMPAEQLVLRQLAYDAEVKFYFVRRAEQLRKEQIVRLTDAASRIRNLMVVEKDITPMRIWAITEAQKRSKGLDFVIVDYDQLVIEAGIDPDKDEDSFFRHQRRFIIDAKRMAEDQDLCFILLCQLRKMPPKLAQGGRPMLDDLYGDSAIRNTPHVIVWIVREYFQHDLDERFERKVRLYVIKSRNDRVGRIQLEFDPEKVRLLDAPPTEKDSVPDTSRDPGEE